MFQFKKIKITLSIVLAVFVSLSFGASVAVHDPSVVLVYKDEAGNSYPEQNAGGTLTKFYYIFGTHLGATYSKDLINWTNFTPTFSVNGNVTNDVYQAFKAGADWSGWTNAETLRGNLWAPDIIYNKTMKKWCLYFSVNGDDWMSSVTLHTADKIEGPYEYAGTVVWGGMDNQSVGKAGNLDYQKVTGSATIDARYYQSNSGKDLGKWDGGYGVSAIDPSVFYDQEGKLWLLYGSWSGGIFLLELDEKTGLRDYNVTYGKGATWDGTRLKKDEYMGTHIAGGYYVSGEGPYIEYMVNNKGEGYYYLFISYGFYSPEGGYTMRVFRSKTVDGDYVDVSGDNAIFARYEFNYGNSTKYGFPIILNYKWDHWADGYGEVADGHNSLLTDDDGKYYVVYHRKMDNGTAWHNVEVHQLFFNDMGWIGAAPFEYREGFGLPAKALSTAQIAGHYRVITHDPTDYENLVTNKEKDLYLNADGSVTGAYTGTWTYDFANGANYLSIKTSGTTFSAFMADGLMNDVSKKTLTFSAMNANGERALWGYKIPKTEVVNEVVLNEKRTVGSTDKTTAWDAYDAFEKVDATENFAIEFKFKNNSDEAENWHNWVLAFKNGSETWYLRADAYSVETFTGSTVGYNTSWGDDWAAFKNLFKNAEVELRAERSGSTINVVASIAGQEVYRASATNTPAGDYEIYLGADNAYLELGYEKVGALENRVLVGKINDAGVYTSAFNAEQTTEYQVGANGDFNLTFTFMNYGNKEGADVWDNYIISGKSGAATALIRADNYALEDFGTTTFEADFEMTNAAKILRNAKVELNIQRVGNELTYTSKITAMDGKEYHSKAITKNAPTGVIAYALTLEQSAVDLLEVRTSETVGEEVTDGKIFAQKLIANFTAIGKRGSLEITAQNSGNFNLYNLNGKRLGRYNFNAGTTTINGIKPGVYIVKNQKILVK